jgi:peptidoglycan-associated lipoprotein
MSVLTNTTPSLLLTAALLAAGALACRKPAPAPQPEPARTAPAPAPAKAAAQQADTSPQRKADEAAEASRKAEAAYQMAAAAALRDVHFDYDQAGIGDSEKPVLSAIAAFMAQYPQASLLIDGNCDERGTVEYNLALGERRAQAALAYLTGLGVPAARLSMTSYGKEKPVCTEPVESCWARNRRAHFTLK